MEKDVSVLSRAVKAPGKGQGRIIDTSWAWKRRKSVRVESKRSHKIQYRNPDRCTHSVNYFHKGVTVVQVEYVSWLLQHKKEWADVWNSKKRADPHKPKPGSPRELSRGSISGHEEEVHEQEGGKPLVFINDARAKQLMYKVAVTWEISETTQKE